jgi:hypothetical protein
LLKNCSTCHSEGRVCLPAAGRPEESAFSAFWRRQVR